jgi:hypothetical protein
LQLVDALDGGVEFLLLFGELALFVDEVVEELLLFFESVSLVVLDFAVDL